MQEKRPEVKLCLAEPADAPLVASGYKMDRPRVVEIGLFFSAAITFLGDVN